MKSSTPNTVTMPEGEAFEYRTKNHDGVWGEWQDAQASVVMSPAFAQYEFRPKLWQSVDKR